MISPTTWLILLQDILRRLWLHIPLRWLGESILQNGWYFPRGRLNFRKAVDTEIKFHEVSVRRAWIALQGISGNSTVFQNL